MQNPFSQSVGICAYCAPHFFHNHICSEHTPLTFEIPQFYYFPFSKTNHGPPYFCCFFLFHFIVASFTPCLASMPPWDILFGVIAPSHNPFLAIYASVMITARFNQSHSQQQAPSFCTIITDGAEGNFFSLSLSSSSLEYSLALQPSSSPSLLSSSS